MLREEDDHLAVLNAMKGSHTLPAYQLFRTLPVILRNRWSEKYLTDVMLRELIQGDYVQVRQVGPGMLEYALTPKGEREVRL